MIDRPSQGRVAVADADSPLIRVYVSDGSADVVGEFNGHSSPVVALAYNEHAKTVVSADRWMCNLCFLLKSFLS